MESSLIVQAKREIFLKNKTQNETAKQSRSYLKLAPGIELLELLLGSIHVHKIGCFTCDPWVLQSLEGSQPFLRIQNN